MGSPQPQEGSAEATSTALLVRARASQQSGERDEANRLYLQVLDASPQNLQALYLYGQFNAEGGELDAAGWFFGQVATLAPDIIEGHLAVADLALQRGRNDEAIAGYRQVLRVQPEHPGALSDIAPLLIQRGFADDADLAWAVGICRSAIALFADPSPAYVILGRILLADGRNAEAIAAYKAALDLAPYNANALAGLGMAFLNAGDRQGALKAADEALAISPNLYDALFARGSALLALNQPKTAIGVFERGVALASDQARMELGLGDAHAELDHNREALEHLVRAVALDPASKWAQANLGSMLYRCGDLENAERHCRLALAADPSMAVVHRNLAGIHTDRGEDDLARYHRDQAFALGNVLVKHAVQSRAKVLILSTAGNGNIPNKHLLPADQYTRIEWFIEYATPGQAAELPDYDVVFNIIGDADFSEPTDEPVATFVETCSRPVLNDPARVGPTRRDRLPGLLAGIKDVVVPAVARLDPSEAEGVEPCAWLAEADMATPVLIRPMGSHGGRGLTLASTPEELAETDINGGVYATEYVDYRAVSDNLFRKYRMIFIDRQPYPYHLAIKNGWLVHYFSSEMTDDTARQAEELRFLEDPTSVLGERAMTALAAIGARLDMDYAGVDFSILPDGQVLVFEANATMLVHPESDEEFAYKNPYFKRIAGAFRALVETRAAET